MTMHFHCRIQIIFFIKDLNILLWYDFTNHKKNVKILYLINYKLINKLIKFNFINL